LINCGEEAQRREDLREVTTAVARTAPFPLNTDPQDEHETREL
jgi:hypothetical protein